MINDAAKRIVDSFKFNASKTLQETGAGIVHGQILSVSPLEIMVDNRLKLPEEFFIVSALCQIIYSWSSVFFTENEPHSHYLREMSTTTANNHVHDVSRVAVKPNDGKDHKHELEEFATERQNGHFHIVKPKGILTKKNEPFGEITMMGYTENNYNFLHFHEIDKIKIPTEPAEDGHIHEIELSEKTIMTLLRSTLWRNIRPGDLVNMIMSSDKQKFYVIERQGMGGIQ